ncbi:MAG: HU family DNA-binding protein, partial [Candidatus Adiutrix sp.]
SGITKSQADKVLTTLVDTVTSEIKSTGNITLSGLGSFNLVRREPRKGHNPKTMEPMDIPASNTVKFKTAKALKDFVN